MAESFYNGEINALDAGLYTDPQNRWQGPPIKMHSMQMADFDKPLGQGTQRRGEIASHLFVGNSGDVEIVDADGNVHLLENMIQGRWHKMIFQQINSANTTATGLIWGS